MIYVILKFSNKMNSQAALMTESEIEKLGWFDGYDESFPDCDILVTGFEDAEEAVAFARQTMSA